MPILLYCVTEPRQSDVPEKGVSGSQVLQCAQDGVVTFFSSAVSAVTWTKAPLAEAAKEFHQVLNLMFQSGAIVPFRFPTIMQTDEELKSHLKENADKYRVWLTKFQNDVQMEALISYPGESVAASAASGAAYLKEKQRRQTELEQVADTVKLSVTTLTKDWRQRTVQQGIRCFALLERASVTEFNTLMRSLRVPGNVSVRVNGPWHVAEFLESRKP
jgi:Gas vesicle synthesis protein GvpL/GvpF